MRLILALVACFAMPAFSAEPLKTFGDDTEVCACYADNKAACVRFDKPQELGLSAIEWYLFGKTAIPVEPWEACDEARCYGSDEDVAKACPSEWVVAANKIPLKTTQPLYACNLQCIATKKLGKEIGRTGKEGEAECAGPLEPPWASGTKQYQFTENAGKKGVALCEPSK